MIKYNYKIDWLGDFLDGIINECLQSALGTERGKEFVMRKFGCVLLAMLTMLFACLCPSSMVAYGASYGDVNNDGRIDASDALLVLQHSVELVELKDRQLEFANVDRMEAVDASDALSILQYSVGLINRFGIFEDSDYFLETERNQMKWEGYVLDLIYESQDKMMKEPGVWENLYDAHITKVDDNGLHWAGEFWGKLLRGGCLVYEYTQDEELYQILTNAVEYALNNRDEYGLMVSYSKENWFCGWDLQVRKYTLLGLEHYYYICKDESLKAELLQALIVNANNILEYVGPEEQGKKPITQTSTLGGSMNCMSIMQPIVKMYRITGEQRYLDFAEYILSTGLSDAGNVLFQAYNNDLPREYSAWKAYELLSTFEGVAEYCRITRDAYCLQAITNLYNNVRDHEMTIVGGVGTDGEFFGYSTREQSNPDYTNIMQEDCVTVTWIKFCYQMLLLTGNSEIVDTIEQTMYNVLAGCANPLEDSCKTFDSYTRLVFATRTYGMSGGGWPKEGYLYNCCGASGPSGVSMFPKIAMMKTVEGGVAVNLFARGQDVFEIDGTTVTFEVDTDYPAAGEIAITLKMDESVAFPVKVRIPSFSRESTLTVNGNSVSAVSGTYSIIERKWNDGDVIHLSLDMSTYLIEASQECTNEKGRNYVALKRGPLTLARDQRLQKESIIEAVDIVCDQEGRVDAKLVENTAYDSIVCLEIPTSTGSFLVTDFSSVGHTNSSSSLYSAWLPSVDYWSLGEEDTVVISTLATDLYVVNTLYLTPSVSGVTFGTAKDEWVMEPSDREDYYYLRLKNTDTYLTADGDTLSLSAKADGATAKLQMWSLEDIRLDQRAVCNLGNRKYLSCQNGQFAWSAEETGVSVLPVK